jgi:hypothetical protein
MQKSGVGEYEIAEPVVHPFASRHARGLNCRMRGCGRPVGDSAARLA